ncbi:hypothetical protein HDU91_004885 [Kappamyces sp. JEL0680]|nr:hypothetical protein HDU91_004885 [Kappamyces sp. JEL0680]
MLVLGLVFVATKTSDLSVSKSLFLPLWNSAVSIIGVSIGSFVRFLATTPANPAEASEFKTLATICFFGILGGLYTAWVAWRSRRMVATMNVIVNLATEILTANSSLFVLSATLSIFHLAFSIFWLWLFAHIFLQGQLVPSDGGMNIVMHPSGPYIAFYFVLLYFWTSSLLQNIEKVTVSSVVGEWYFDRFDHTNTTDETWFHFQYVSSRSLGTIAFASLILGLVRTIQFLIRQIERYGSRKVLNYRIVAVTIAVLSKLLDDLSSYTLVHVGLTGESLLSSAFQCARLFRRNLILGLLTANLSRLMSFVGKVFVSSVIGLACFWSSVSLTASGGEWITIVVATAIPYYVMGILTHVVETTFVLCTLTI